MGLKPYSLLSNKTMKKQKNKTNWKRLIGFVLIILSISMGLKFLVPLVLNLCSMFLSLLGVYALIKDINFLFIGGAFFLIIYYFVFSAVCSIVIWIFEKGWELIKQ